MKKIIIVNCYQFKELEVNQDKWVKNNLTKNFWEKSQNNYPFQSKMRFLRFSSKILISNKLKNY